MSRQYRPWQKERLIELAMKQGAIATGGARTQPVVSSPTPISTGKRRGAMNKTEARFARLLEAKVARGEIISFEYEGITLRWPDGMRYSPDFVLWVSTTGINNQLYTAQTLVEVKGAHAWAKDVVKFRAARDKWGDRFRFEFYQEINGEWVQTR